MEVLWRLFDFESHVLQNLNWMRRFNQLSLRVSDDPIPRTPPLMEAL